MFESGDPAGQETLNAARNQIIDALVKMLSWEFEAEPDQDGNFSYHETREEGMRELRGILSDLIVKEEVRRLMEEASRTARMIAEEYRRAEQDEARRAAEEEARVAEEARAAESIETVLERWIQTSNYENDSSMMEKKIWVVAAFKKLETHSERKRADGFTAEADAIDAYIRQAKCAQTLEEFERCIVNIPDEMKENEGRRLYDFFDHGELSTTHTLADELVGAVFALTTEYRFDNPATAPSVSNA